MGFAIEPYLTLFMLGLTPLLAISAFIFTKASGMPWTALLPGQRMNEVHMNCVGTAPPPSLRVAADGVLQSGAEAVRPCRCCGRGSAGLHQDRGGLWGRAEGVQQIQREAVRCQEAWSQEGHDLWTQHRLDLLHHLRCLCSLTYVSGVPCAPRCCAVVNSVFHTASR